MKFQSFEGVRSHNLKWGFGERGIQPIINYHRKKRRKRVPLDAKMDLVGEYSFAKCWKVIRVGSSEVDAVSGNEFTHQEDFKLYSQLPDYDEFRGYGLGIDEQLEKGRGSHFLRTSISRPGELRSTIFSRMRRIGNCFGNQNSGGKW